MKINPNLTPEKLLRKIEQLWELSAAKIHSIQRHFDPSKGAPVYTVRGRYTTRGWTEWTQGFQYGSAILQFDATGEKAFLEIGRRNTVERMAPHISHFGVHDHGFNNISTYGNLLRLMNEGRIPENLWERAFYELALKISGAVQARRWTKTADGGGFIYSFNGPHSLFVDSIRSLRSLAIAHKLGHVMMDENDRKISLLDRLQQHAVAIAKYNVRADGGVVHEAIFNINDGNFRCPNSQQGWSPFSTWTRGLAWAMLGFAEQLEFLRTIGQPKIELVLLKAARATCDFYIEHATAADGIPYWDTGAPLLHKLGDWQKKPADPFNNFEPVDSSAAVIAAQGLLRLGHYLRSPKSTDSALKAHDPGLKYWQAGLTVLDTVLDVPYLSTDPRHQGLILHSVYHRPNRWDYVPRGRKIPCGESSMWGDYHAREVALYIQRVARGQRYLAFWG
ncbi:MAG: glycosyl hydrolase [Verrucomicrobiae bacterium]|nr:glycosyl hydrolase [Verrucomicrobiae bacterium]